MNTPAVCQHAFMIQLWWCRAIHQHAAMQQQTANVFKLSFEYLHIYSPKSGDFCRKNSKIASLMLSKVRFTENTEIQSEPRFRGYSMNTWNIYRRCPWRKSKLTVLLAAAATKVYPQTGVHCMGAHSHSNILSWQGLNPTMLSGCPAPLTASTFNQLGHYTCSTQNSPFLPEWCQYSLCTTTEGWPGWVAWVAWLNTKTVHPKRPSISLPTRFDVEQLCWCAQRCYH